MKTLPTVRPAAPEAPDAAGAPLRQWELVGILVLVLCWFWLRRASVYNHPWDSDETQHLHVVWGWTQGLIPYRDFFDNHTPLFHLLFAPVFNLFGERPDIVDLARWCMVALAGLVAWCTYRIGAQVFSRRTGIVAALLCAFYPSEYFKTGEFRTDVLWTVLWLATLVLLTKPRLTRGHRFLAGLAFGATFATSQKTVLLALVLLAGSLLTCLLIRAGKRRSAVPPGAVPSPAAAFTLSFWLGLILIPGLLLTSFYLEGAWSQMVYCVIRHNLVKVAGSEPPLSWSDLRNLRFWLIIPAAIAGWLILDRSTERDRAGRQVWVLMVGGSYCTLLLGIWTVVSAQDYLPYFPVALVGAAAGLSWLGRRIVRRLPRHPWVPPLLLAALLGPEISWLVKSMHFSDRRNRFRVEQIREVLALTRPDEPVLDAKGGSVYRPRAIPYVMETLTRLRMREGLLENDIAERLVARRTAVAINLSWFPGATKTFVDRNYLYVGLVHVAGRPVQPDADGTIRFRIEIPNRYVFIDASGLVSGRLDGGQAGDRFEVEPGDHSFQPGRPLSGPCDVLVESAYNAGFTPFNTELQALEPLRKVVN
ncbi:MAG: glycosyltransferase family 39 protein [Verrucomicrobia bacterium]|nr:glycosyltransferase family 39 protein [Verrucomicrobiota bacterium]